LINFKEFEYPSCFVDLADELAHLRTFHSKHVYKKGTEKYRGEQEHKISMLGILAELIARHYFKDSDIEVAKLIDENPIVDADIILHGIGETYLIDVKGVKSKSKKLRINFKAQNNTNKEISHYFFIQPITRNKARYCWIPHADVFSWNVIESTYTKVYEKEISE